MSPSRNGQKLAVVAEGDRRRLSDARSAWRKMTPEQKEVFKEFMGAESDACRISDGRKAWRAMTPGERRVLKEWQDFVNLPIDPVDAIDDAWKEY